MSVKFYFCIGSQKTGTTLLARVLDQHPDIACLHESYVMLPKHPSCLLASENYRHRDFGFSDDSIERIRRRMDSLRRSPWRRFLGRLYGPAWRRADLFSSAMRELLSEFGRIRGARVVGDKWPFYGRHMDVLLQAFPDARFLYNVRDPRAVWLSGQRFKNRNRGDFILDDMLELDRKIAPYLSRPEFIAFRYEDLVENHAHTVEWLYTFLGCAFRQEYLEYHADDDPSPGRWSWVPEAKEAVNVYHARKWRDALSDETISRIEARSRDFMEKWDYEPVTRSLPT